MTSVFDNRGYTYAQPRKETAWTNPLTKEEEKALHTTSSGISIDIPKEDMYRAKCTHRHPELKCFAVKPNADGTVTCEKCGSKFNIVQDVDIEEIRKLTGGMIDILQTIKLAYVDMPAHVVEAYFAIIPFLEIVPQLYEAAMHTLNNVAPNVGVTQTVNSQNAFATLYNTIGNPGMMMAGMQAPVGYMNAPMGPVAYANNPMQTQVGMGGSIPVTMPGVTETVDNPRPADAATGGVKLTSKFKLD